MIQRKANRQIYNRRIKHVPTVLDSELCKDESRIIELLDIIAECESELKTIKAKYLERMSSLNLSRIDSDVVVAHYYKDSIINSLDTAKLKQEHPDIYDKYKKCNIRKGYVSFTLDHAKI